MPFSAAASELQDPVEAAHEAAEAIVADLGLGPDAALAFFTGHHTGSAEQMAAAIRGRLLPSTFVGASAVSVVSGDREIEQSPAVSVWAGSVGAAHPVRFTFHRDADSMHIEGIDEEALAAAHTLILIPDPFTFPADLLVRGLAERHPALQVIGGFASSSPQPGGNRLLLDEAVFSSGAVGMLLSGPIRVSTVVSQGCRPIGRPLVVTKAEANVIRELAGRPAYEQLVDLIRSLSTADRALASQGLHLGRVIDERKLDFERGDFLIRGVMAADEESGTLTVGDVVPVGSTVQFQVRDASSADNDLRELVSGAAADAALLFTCNGRGLNMFDRPHHDASIVSDKLNGAPIGGMFCAGELGPVGDRNFLHGYTASLALFHEV
jgi:small ligand-binding sensory domain FIST